MKDFLMSSWFPWLLVVIAVALAWVSWRLTAFILPPDYAKDKRNPARRYCMVCGQQQDFYQWAWDANCGNADGWWQAHGKIHDPDCRCHEDCGQ